MRDIIMLLADMVNLIHDLLIGLFGTGVTDKELHFWIIGIIGIVTFFIVHFFFKIIEKLKWSTIIFSFIYTFTLMIVLVFAIELQQAVTNRGNMEFADAMIGLWGFLVFFIVYAAIALAVYFTVKMLKVKGRHSRN